MTSIFIQWKGTDVCCDFYCKCGNTAHIDADFMYNIRCLSCKAVYKVPNTVELEETALIGRECCVDAEDSKNS